MNEFFLNSTYAGVMLSLATYFLGVFLKKKLNKGFINPLLISIILCIAVLLLGHVSYEAYYQSAKVISWFLTPATVCLAIPLYEQLPMLKKHWRAVLLGLAAGVVTSLTTVWVLSLLCGLDHASYVTLLPKSITTAIGMGFMMDSPVRLRSLWPSA